MSKLKGERTRAQIIEGAVRALAEVGVLGVTTRKIAAAAGVQLAALHYHFQSKSELLLAVLDWLIGEITSGAARRRRGPADPRRVWSRSLARRGAG